MREQFRYPVREPHRLLSVYVIFETVSLSNNSHASSLINGLKGVTEIFFNQAEENEWSMQKMHRGFRPPLYEHALVDHALGEY